MDIENLAAYQKALKLFTYDAMANAKIAHEYIFKDEKYVSVAIAYLNKAVAKMAAAESLYYARYDELAHDDIECLFHQFDVFSRELLNNFRTGHSHQWTDIEFESLEENYQNSVCSEPIN